MFGCDLAVTADGGDYSVICVVGLDPEGRMFLLDLWRKQASSDEWVEKLCDMILQWKPQAIGQETGQIRAGIGPFLTRHMRRAYAYTEVFPTKGDKAVRAQSVRSRMAMEGLHVPTGAPWYPAFRSELLSFPAFGPAFNSGEVRLALSDLPPTLDASTLNRHRTDPVGLAFDPRPLYRLVIVSAAKDQFLAPHYHDDIARS